MRYISALRQIDRQIDIPLGINKVNHSNGYVQVQNRANIETVRNNKVLYTTTCLSSYEIK